MWTGIQLNFTLSRVLRRHFRSRLCPLNPPPAISSSSPETQQIPTRTPERTKFQLVQRKFSHSKWREHDRRNLAAAAGCSTTQERWGDTCLTTGGVSGGREIFFPFVEGARERERDRENDNVDVTTTITKCGSFCFLCSPENRTAQKFGPGKISGQQTPSLETSMEAETVYLHLITGTLFSHLALAHVQTCWTTFESDCWNFMNMSLIKKEQMSLFLLGSVKH